MVRFSDIIKIKDQKDAKRKATVEKVREDRFRLSDSHIFKIDQDKPVREPGHDRSIARNEEGLEAVTYYEKFIERALDIKFRVQNNQGISPSPILSDLHHIIDKNLIDDLYDYAVSAQDDYDEMMVHTTAVTYTALKVGRGMNYDIKMLLRLGIAAFLENVGMYRIPESILKSTVKLGSEEIKIIKSHPLFSQEILSGLGERYKWLADVAVQVHERSDGSGYPAGLKDREISELASIIGLVDTYVAMIKNRPYREKFIQTDAIKSIVEASKGLFPPKIVRTFLNQISLFPVNSYIRLNNGSIGRVISTDNKQPLRPTIELLYDGQKNELMNRPVINLSDNPLLYIDGSVRYNEISNL